jgi:hypothetical protein
VGSNSLIGLGRTIVFASQYASNYTVITRDNQYIFIGNFEGDGDRQKVLFFISGIIELKVDCRRRQ